MFLKVTFFKDVFFKDSSGHFYSILEQVVNPILAKFERLRIKNSFDKPYNMRMLTYWKSSNLHKKKAKTSAISFKVAKYGSISIELHQLLNFLNLPE